MTTSITVNVHFKPGEIRHRFYPATDSRPYTYGALDIGSGDLNDAILYLDNPAEVDEVMAHLVALRAEMTAETAYRLTPAGEAEAAKPLPPTATAESRLCEYCDVEPATEGRYCTECAQAVAETAASPA